MNELETVAALGTEGDLDAVMAEVIARGSVEVPVLPAVARQVEDLVRGGDYPLDRLTRLVTVDPGLAAEVLAAANADTPDEVHAAASVAQAIERLDPLALSSAALRAARRGRAVRGPLAELRRRAWRDALGCALLCRDLARARGLPDDEAFTAGLLHDVGRGIAIAALEQLAQGAQHPRSLSSRWWNAVVDRYHVELGVEVALRHGFPRRLLEVIAHHHEAPLDPSAAGMLEVVVACDAVARAFADGTHVRAEDVTAIRALSERDVEVVARTVDGIPAFLGALERAGGRTAVPRSPALGPRLAIEPPEARVRVAGVDYQVVGFAPHQIFIRGAVPLPEGLLLEVEVPRDPERVFHARVLMCWPEGERFGAVLAPFALAGPAYLHWQGLVALRARS